MEAAILWLLIWAVLAFGLPSLIVWAFGGLGFLVGDDAGFVIGGIVGWILAIVWFIFAAWRAILEIITIVQLVSG